MRKDKSPPPVPGHLVLGNSLQYVRDPLGFLLRVAREYGDVASLRLGGETCVLLANPEDIETVLCTAHDKFCRDKLIWRSPLRLAWRMVPVMRKRLLISEADNFRRQPNFWRRQRRMVQPAFQPLQVTHYAPLIREETERFIAGWQDRQAIELVGQLTALTLVILSRCLFGMDVRSSAAQINGALAVLIDRMLRPRVTSHWRQRLPLPADRRLASASRLLHSIIYDTIRKGRAGGVNRGGGLLTLLLNARDEAGLPLNDEAVHNEILTMFMAAHETTALGIAYGLHLLFRDAAALDRAVAEVKYSDERPFLECVAKESHRLYPPAWLIGREAKTDCEIGGYAIRAGTQVLISPWVVHRDPRWYDAADEFRPERWTEGLIRRLRRCAYFPFGHGPAICVGEGFAMEETLQIMAAIVGRFHLLPLVKGPLNLRATEALRPDGGIWMRVERRTAGTPPSNRSAAVRS